MVVLGLIGRPDEPLCHDGAACLVVDGTVVGALEQERISRRRHAQGEGPDDAFRVLLGAHGVHPAEVQAIGFAWRDAPIGSPSIDGPVPCGVHVSDKLTDTILPTLAAELGTRDIFFFDHHLCHAAQAYCLNPYTTVDILVADGWGGDGSTSLFHADNGDFRLLERFDRCWSLGMLYGAASAYAKQGWWGAGKLMGLSSYGRRSDFRYLTFDAATGDFTLNPALRGVVPNGLSWGRLGSQWLEIFEESVFPFTSASGNTFDYAPFAADIQATIEELGLGLAARLRRLSGEDTLLLSGGIALNAIMNRRIAREGGYQNVSGTVAPNDGGTVFGAAMLAQRLLGKPIQPLPAGHPPPIFFGPPVSTSVIEAALERWSIAANRMDSDKLRVEVAAALARGEIVAWFDGPNEFGPRALGARSLLAAPTSRTILDKLNRMKGREPWRPAALSLTAEGFSSLDMEPPISGLTDYMLCTHHVGEVGMRQAIAGVHVDGTTRAQYVPPGTDGFSALLRAVGEESGLPAVINTSLNTRGSPMVLTAEQAIELMYETSEVDVLAAVRCATLVKGIGPRHRCVGGWQARSGCADASSPSSRVSAAVGFRRVPRGLQRLRSARVISAGTRLPRATAAATTYSPPTSTQDIGSRHLRRTRTLHLTAVAPRLSLSTLSINAEAPSHEGRRDASPSATRSTSRVDHVPDATMQGL